MAEPTPLHQVTAAGGASFAEDAGFLLPAHFGEAAAEYQQAHQGAVIFDRSPRAKVAMTGADAARFLHNLSTNDILRLPAGTGCEAFLTTLKARVVAYLLVYHLPGPVLWLDGAPGMGQKVIQHLDHYLISELVELRDASAELAQVHVAGPRSAAIVGELFAELVPGLAPMQAVDVRTAYGECQVRRRDGLGVPGHDLLCPMAHGEVLWKAVVNRGARPAGQVVFEALRIAAGTPAEGLDVDENTFAPEVGRTAEAISYSKGCYLGQEPIVMARDRGQINRLLCKIELPGGPVPHNSLLYAEGKDVGRVTSSAAIPGREEAVGLAYVRRGHQAPGTELEVEVGGQRQRAVLAGQQR
jgi:folate-binding protein YgfZ